MEFQFRVLVVHFLILVSTAKKTDFRTESSEGKGRFVGVVLRMQLLRLSMGLVV